MCVVNVVHRELAPVVCRGVVSSCWPPRSEQGRCGPPCLDRGKLSTDSFGVGLPSLQQHPPFLRDWYVSPGEGRTPLPETSARCTGMPAPRLCPQSPRVVVGP